MIIKNIKYILAILLLVLSFLIPGAYYFWAKYIAEISWQSWAGIPLYILVIGPIACFFAISTFIYWWEIAAKKSAKYHIFPIACMMLALAPIIIYIYVWFTN